MTSKSTRSEATRPQRQEQALEEIGRTRIGRVSAVLLVAAFAATLLLPPALRWATARGVMSAAEVTLGEETAAVSSPLPAFDGLAGSIAASVATARGEGLLAGNRRLLAGIESFEDEIEEGSLLRHRLLPPAQLALTRWLGAGNEQAYLGSEGWLYYRPDVDHLTGPGFLEPEVLERRRRAGDSWERPPEPDPFPALERFAADLAARGIELWLLPTPVKPALEPERLARRAVAEVPLRNPSWPELERRIAAAGLVMLDPATWLADARRNEPTYLATDTHWTPDAMEAVAERLASELAPELAGSDEEPTTYFRRTIVAEGRGDIERMLDLPLSQTLFSRREVELELVVTAAGRSWRPTPGASVLLLGDSFTNVFSDAGLGWGQGAGLAEQLSYYLERPIDRIARNAGGSSASRQALLEALSVDPGRLDRTRVVVYQFAARELSGGDWPVLPLPEP